MTRTLHVALMLALAACTAGLHGCIWLYDRNEIIDGIEFVECPAGEFQMGSTGIAPAIPAHTVTFAKKFWISKYEVTQLQWLAVMKKNPMRQRIDYTAQYPMGGVTWDDTQEFIAALNAARPGKNFRLPSEAEWEYACRAGSGTHYFWGDDPDKLRMTGYAWVPANSGDSTHPVGQLEPNAWGIYDMCGNVWEWVQDYWHDSYEGAPGDGSAWETPATNRRCARGGSYYNDTGCPSAFRAGSGISPDSRYADYGFRIVREEP